MDNWSFIDAFEDFYDIASHKSEDYEKFVYIVGNKKDLYDKEEVSEEQGKKYAEDNGALFSQTSAKDDREGFIEFVLELIKKFIEEKNDNEQQRESLTLNNSKKKKKKFC